MQFLDADPGFTAKVESAPDATYNVGATPSISLGDWLSRPQKIFETTITTGTTPVAQSIKPWDLFFSNVAVKQKLENYALLRCKLKVKFVVNAAPSYYGQYLCSYRPLLDHPLMHATIPGFNDESLIQHSQRLHVFLRFGQNLGGCLCLPFFSPRNWLRIADKEQFENMGEIVMMPMTELRNTNGAAGSVTVSVFCWAEEVQVAQTTTSTALQSSLIDTSSYYLEGDEYDNPGYISTPASAIAAVAGRLSDVPIIGPFAKATQISASAVASVAKIFGFSKPPVLNAPMPMKNKPFSSLAMCGGGELVDRLVVDPKQELTVDSRTVGLDGTDELTIESFVTRESYLATATWIDADPTDTLLWNSYVTPNLSYMPVATVEYPTPMDYAAIPFTYWSGDIIYRFQVVATKFHRGRLLIQWDPDRVITADYSDHVNEVATQVLDLAVTRDFSFRVPYAAPTGFLQLTDQRGFGVQNYDTAPLLLLRRKFHNGAITLSVLNNLTTLGTDLPIKILISVRAAPNMRYAAPRQLKSNAQFVKPASDGDTFFAEGLSEPGDTTIDDRSAMEGAPVSEDVTPILPLQAPIDHIPDVYFGEQILSFRTLLKRYSRSYDGTFTGGSTGNRRIRLTSVLPRFPVMRGQDANGMYGVTVGRANFTQITIFNVIAACFIGMRGGYRWKLNTCGAHHYDTIRIERSTTNRSVSELNKELNIADSITTSAFSLLTALEATNNQGYSLTNGRTQTGVEVELPHYSHTRFHGTNQTNSFKGAVFDKSDVDSMRIVMEMNDPAADAAGSSYTLYGATGEDFNFFYFINVPPIYYYNIDN